MSATHRNLTSYFGGENLNNTLLRIEDIPSNHTLKKIVQMKPRNSWYWSTFSLYSHQSILPFLLSKSDSSLMGFLFCFQSLMSIMSAFWLSLELLSWILNQICLWPPSTASFLKDWLVTDWIKSVGKGSGIIWASWSMRMEVKQQSHAAFTVTWEK